MLRILALASILCLAVTDGAGVPLQNVLIEQLRRFNSTEELREELRVVAEESAGLLKLRAEGTSAFELANDLISIIFGNATYGASLQAERASARALERLAEADHVLAILARRLILARVVLVWLERGQVPFDDELEQRLIGITEELYGVHVREVVRKGIMQHLHISKSGGTSFSHAARSSNCRMPRGLGQPPYLADFPHWLNRTALRLHAGSMGIWWRLWGEPRRDTEVQTCEQRLEAVAGRGLQYISNEYTLHGGLEGMAATHVCRRLVNVVTIRHPEKRLVSHVFFLLAYFSTFMRHAHHPPEHFASVFCADNSTVWLDVAPPILDNFIVRSFLGEAGFHTPPGALGPAHVAAALRLLLQFDLVLDLDAGHGAVHAIMRQGLGWNTTLEEVHSRPSSQVFSSLNFTEAERCRNQALLREVLPRQEPDRRLYRTGRVVSFLDALLLSLARHLGLRPHPDATTAAGAAAAPDVAADKARYPCGLLSFAAGRPHGAGEAHGGPEAAEAGEEDPRASAAGGGGGGGGGDVGANAAGGGGGGVTQGRRALQAGQGQDGLRSAEG